MLNHPTTKTENICFIVTPNLNSQWSLKTFFVISFVLFFFLFYITAPAPPRKTRGELYKDVDADYYGYRDEDDGVLVPLEQEVEKEGRSTAISGKEKFKSSTLNVGSFK